MARGTLVGMIWGVVVSGVGLGAASVGTGPAWQDIQEKRAMRIEAAGAMAETDAMDDGAVMEASDEAMADEEPAADMVDGKDEAMEEPIDTGPEVIADSDKSGLKPAPEADAPELASTDSLTAPEAPTQIGADTSPLAAPNVGEAPEAPAQSDSATGINVEVSSEAPAMPAPQGEALDAPAADDAPLAIADPAQPPIPAVPETQTALTEEPEEQSEPEPVVVEPVEEPAEEEQIAVLTETEERPKIGTPAGSLINREPAVQQSRFAKRVRWGTVTAVIPLPSKVAHYLKMRSPPAHPRIFHACRLS